MDFNLRKSSVMVGFVGTAFVASFPIFAHHSFPATYRVDQTQTIEGKVVQFLFRNPHSLVNVLVKAEDGTEQRWRIEWAAASALASSGTDGATLKVGDEVVIVGSPARNPDDRMMLMRSVERPADGWKWSGRVD